MHSKSAAIMALLIGAGLLTALGQIAVRADREPGPPPEHGMLEVHSESSHHEHWWHHLQDWAIGLLGGVHPHASDHGPKHDLEPSELTRFSERTEFFIEVPPLIAGEASELLVHLTRLSDFKPVSEGELEITLSNPNPSSSGGPSEESFTSPAPARPGLFRLPVTPTAPGERRIRIALTTPEFEDAHDLGVAMVYQDVEAAETAPAQTDSDQGVVLLKEQQWRADFGTAVAAPRLLRGSVPASGFLRPSADGEAHVTTPIDAHLRSAPEGFPYTGMPVAEGQIIAYLVPKLGGESDLAGLELGVKRAVSARDLARQERERLDTLWRQRSIPYRELLQARSAEEVAEAELAAAGKRLAQVKRTPEGETAGVPVRAPIAGVVGRVSVAPGGFVQEGDHLFYLVDADRMWLEARVAEADIGQILKPVGAWFRVQGFDSVYEVTPRTGAHLVGFSAVVDPESRTVAVTFEFPRLDPRLRVGQAVSARVLTGQEQEALAVPAGALVNDAGAEVVYVQTGGERFERRLVRAGLRDGAYVAIEEGLKPGERVVTRGAYLVHLAAGAPPETGHGHVH